MIFSLSIVALFVHVVCVALDDVHKKNTRY